MNPFHELFNAGNAPQSAMTNAAFNAQSAEMLRAMNVLCRILFTQCRTNKRISGSLSDTVFTV